MQQLQALMSVTSAGVTYAEYERRVLDAKVAIDRYLGAHGHDDAAIVRPIARAITLYVFAASIWNVSFNTSGDLNYRGQKFIHDNREQTAQVCLAAAEIWDEAVKKNYSSEYYGEMLRVSLSPVWQCASDSLTEAGKALAAR